MSLANAYQQLGYPAGEAGTLQLVSDFRQIIAAKIQKQQADGEPVTYTLPAAGAYTPETGQAILTAIQNIRADKESVPAMRSYVHDEGYRIFFGGVVRERMAAAGFSANLIQHTGGVLNFIDNAEACIADLDTVYAAEQAATADVTEGQYSLVADAPLPPPQEVANNPPPAGTTGTQTLPPAGEEPKKDSGFLDGFSFSDIWNKITGIFSGGFSFGKFFDVFKELLSIFKSARDGLNGMFEEAGLPELKFGDNDASNANNQTAEKTEAPAPNSQASQQTQSQPSQNQQSGQQISQAIPSANKTETPKGGLAAVTNMLRPEFNAVSPIPSQPQAAVDTDPQLAAIVEEAKAITNQRPAPENNAPHPVQQYSLS